MATSLTFVIFFGPTSPFHGYISLNTAISTKFSTENALKILIILEMSDKWKKDPIVLLDEVMKAHNRDFIKEKDYHIVWV